MQAMTVKYTQTSTMRCIIYIIFRCGQYFSICPKLCLIS